MASSTIRHLSTTTTKKISISKAKSRLRTEHDPDKALAIFSSASSNESSPPFVSRYAQDLTVRRLAKSHRFADIESLLESHKSNPQIKQEPFLSSLIRSYGVAGMFDQALKTYQEMDQLGTPRSCISFNSLLSACIQSKLYNKVPVLFNEISEKYRVLPDKVSYGMLMKAYCEDGKPEKAIEVLMGMEKKGVEVTTIVCTPVLNCLYSKGKNEEADRFLDWMVERGCELDAVVYNVKISNAVNQGAESVKELIEEMKNSGLKPDTISYNYLMTSYCMSGMMEEAKKVYEGLTVHGCKANPATYRTLVFNLCKNGEYEKGYKIFRDSVREHRIPDFNTLKYLAKGLVEKKKIKEAKGLIHTMKKKFPPNLLNAWRKLEENLGLQSTEENKEVKEATD
ncbi:MITOCHONDRIAL GROUP I INTRON SPLICING FACTOR CCM1 [Salix koriyanagi]|uniref:MITOCHONDRIAL GROUP I INTRON SPLICING FACTOR CCM1 n=1 Tax=Salix koriyanagi TaxID=2511006 RepID=A0A9Q0UML4_9ROSI|nr:MITOCHONDRIAL GROUP I INTRON SPLICING FACTOR CCM1 [Salix koriyanagi]